MQNVNQYDDCRVDIDFILNIESLKYHTNAWNKVSITVMITVIYWWCYKDITDKKGNKVKRVHKIFANISI